MSHGRSFVVRSIVFLLGALCAAFAAFEVGLSRHWLWAEQLYARLDLSLLGDLPAQQNYPLLLGEIAAVLLLVGVVLFAVVVQFRRLGGRTASASTPAGTITFHPADVASAVAQDLARLPGVTKTRHKAVVDRRRQLLDIEIYVNPDVDVTGLAAACEQAERDVLTALPSGSIRPRFRLLVSQPR